MRVKLVTKIKIKHTFNTEINHTLVFIFSSDLCDFVQSCPPIQVYSAKNLERGLAMAARNFCAQEVEVVPEARRVRLSKIFLWYGSDFGASERELLQ